MPLTPQDVHNKVFGPTRMRRGYDEGEVDAFLDEVEAELIRLHREIDALKAQLADPSRAGGAGSGERSVAMSPAGAASQVAAVASESGEPADLEQRVARALVLAQRAADEAVRDAERQAEQLRAEALAEAERIRAEVQSEAERQRSELDRSRSAAEADVEQLRAFEREYRSRLRAYLQLQLQELDGSGGSGGAAEEPAALGAAASSSGQSVTLDKQPAAGSGYAAGGYGGEQHGMAGTNGAGGQLLTTPLPADDPATVPQVNPAGQQPETGPSIPVPEANYSAGVSLDTPGEELRHEPRGLHEDL